MKIPELGSATRKGPLAVGGRLQMKTPSLCLLVCLAMLALSAASLAPAQQVAKGDRKLVTRVEPDYPPMLKMRQIGGTVRLELTITPKGIVKSASVLGGNPVLAESAIAAVKKWVYAPADAVTTEQVSIEFNPYR